jgi:hypothetical protein
MPAAWIGVFAAALLAGGAHSATFTDRDGAFTLTIPGNWDQCYDPRPNRPPRRICLKSTDQAARFSPNHERGISILELGLDVLDRDGYDPKRPLAEIAHREYENRRRRGRGTIRFSPLTPFALKNGVKGFEYRTSDEHGPLYDIFFFALGEDRYSATCYGKWQCRDALGTITTSPKKSVE